MNNKTKIFYSLKISFIIIGILFFGFHVVAQEDSCWDDVKGHCYPRRGIFQWGGGVPDWYAKFDLVDTTSESSDFARAIKEINPHAYVLSTRDMNAGSGFDGVDEWRTKNSTGDPVKIYGGGSYLMNISDYCPKVNGQTYRQAIVSEMIDKALIPDFDGAATDGLWSCIWGQDDVDINLNSKNDLCNNQCGATGHCIIDSTTECRNNSQCPATDDKCDLDPCDADVQCGQEGNGWVCDQWSKGAGDAINQIRSGIGDKLILIQGTTLGDPYYQDYNGYSFEYGSAFAYRWYNGMWQYDTLMSNLREPHIIYIDGAGSWFGRENENTRNDFKLSRFIIATAMMGDGYVSIQPYYKDHYFVSYQDELDLNLGWPTSDMQDIKCTGDNECVMVRFFDQGAVILNVKGQTETISSADISTLPGYTGPYRIFKGGQDPAWNNGNVFSSVSLAGEKLDYGSQYYGDALFLVKDDTVCVSDIIIDNTEFGTSPGSQKAQLDGSGWENGEDGSYNWASADFTWLNSYTYLYNQDKNGEVVFMPTINVPGSYQVFEWHGNHDGSEATNLNYVVSYSGGVSSQPVNQQQNQGQWNSLGTYNFTQGTQGKVTIAASGANGTIIADAVKFVYQGNRGDIKIPSQITVDFNCDGLVNIYDFGILMSCWNKTAGDFPACASKAKLYTDTCVDDLKISSFDISTLGAMMSQWRK